MLGLVWASSVAFPPRYPDAGPFGNVTGCKGGGVEGSGVRSTVGRGVGVDVEGGLAGVAGAEGVEEGGREVA